LFSNEIEGKDNYKEILEISKKNFELLFGGKKVSQSTVGSVDVLKMDFNPSNIIRGYEYLINRITE